MYIFKIPKVSYCSGPLLKYPLGEFYSCTEINKLTEEVWCSLNIVNLKNKEKDFSEYIELYREGSIVDDDIQYFRPIHMILPFNEQWGPLRPFG